MLRSWLLDAQTRILWAKCGFPLAVEHPRANLEQNMGAALAPLHLLFPHHTSAHRPEASAGINQYGPGKGHRGEPGTLPLRTRRNAPLCRAQH
jgi:hypothetical protein